MGLDLGMTLMLAGGGFAILLVLAFLRVPLAAAMMLVGMGGYWLTKGLKFPTVLPDRFERAFNITLNLPGIVFDDVGFRAAFAVLPLFILMGQFIHQSGLSTDLYKAVYRLFHWLRGSLALATIGACAIFAAVSGSSLATAATMAQVAYPSMKKFGYSSALAAGAIAAGGTLGILIPPSVPMVIYGILTETDIGKLFIAGIIPGIILTTAFIISIIIAGIVKPELIPARAPLRPEDNLDTRTWIGVVSTFLLILLVLGGIYGIGEFRISPTEAAGFGSIVALVITVLIGRMNFKKIYTALVNSAKTSAMVIFVLLGAFIFNLFIIETGLVSQLKTLIESSGTSALSFIFLICVIYILLGMVFDTMGLLVLTAPIFYELALVAGVDPIHFGIIVIIVVEIGLITPPIGMNVFTVKSVLPDVGLWTIFNGVWPFVLAAIITLLFIIFFPALSLYLPGLM